MPSERTESVRDAEGREVLKRYYRADGTQYGEEDVWWNDRGDRSGWEFRYTDRDGSTRFDYRYQLFDARGNWTRRVRARDGVPERAEIRRIIYPDGPAALAIEPLPFKLTMISRATSSETSPSFSVDGRRMVFARYGGEWEKKRPFYAHHDSTGWRVSELDLLDEVYNLALSPDGETLYLAVRDPAADLQLETYRSRWTDDGWSRPLSLTREFGLRGTYPSQASNGDVVVFDDRGPHGPGLYRWRARGDGFDADAEWLGPAIHDGGAAPFDGFIHPDGSHLLYTLCTDDTCDSGGGNGFYVARLDGAGGRSPRRIPGLPYGWGGQIVESLGLFVFTDGEDLLTVPLIDLDLDWPSP